MPLEKSGDLNVCDQPLLVKPAAADKPLTISTLGPTVEKRERKAAKPDDRAR